MSKSTTAIDTPFHENCKIFVQRSHERDSGFAAGTARRVRTRKTIAHFARYRAIPSRDSQRIHGDRGRTTSDPAGWKMAFHLRAPRLYETLQ